ncbi:SecDF P1 head subdomain-containing protein [Ruania zhangjianzhongii]|uniref:SecDF P1 head subdomain-containing protein n=1 Tax=Ruania zhangjianzhongii TaxID=2603206 RepID=UPI0011C9F829|nr:hypothetical protein [Ruania zhangjianzhongii]
MGRQLLPLAAAAAVLVGLSGCDLAPPDQDPEQNPSPEQSRSAGTDAGTGEDTASGPIELTSPIEFLLVEEVGEAPCAEGFVAGSEDEECFRLGDGMEVTEVIELELGAEVTQEGAETGAPLVNLTMIEEDGTEFADLTSEALSTATQRVAMVVDGEVVAAPQVAQEIYGGQVQITAWDDAEEFVAEATGG